MTGYELRAQPVSKYASASDESVIPNGCYFLPSFIFHKKSLGPKCEKRRGHDLQNDLTQAICASIDWG